MPEAYCRVLDFAPTLPKKKENMKHFFNLIPGKDSACILLYGEIGDYGKVNSADIVRELLEAEAVYNNIDVRINSIGGDVYAGISIFNAFRNSRANITLYIDGVAASIAGVIAACGKPLKMSKYARLMIHNISGGVWGNTQEMKDCISQMESMEETLLDILSERTTKPREEIKNEWFDGKDHWFTAQEALDLKLVDEIYDTEPVPEDSTPNQIYTIMQNRLENSGNNQTSNMIEKLKKRPAFANCASEEDVLRHIEQLETEAAKVSGLENKVTEFENKERQVLEAEDDALLDAAVEDGRINASERPVHKVLLNSNRENARKALAGLKPQKRIVNTLYQPKPGELSPWEKRQEEIKNKFNK